MSHASRGGHRDGGGRLAGGNPRVGAQPPPTYYTEDTRERSPAAAVLRAGLAVAARGGVAREGVVVAVGLGFPRAAARDDAGVVVCNFFLY